MLAAAAVSNNQIFTEVYDYAVQSRERPSLGRFNYQQLRSGTIILRGRPVRTAPISSLQRAREIAGVMKTWLTGGLFQLSQPVDALPDASTFRPLRTVEAVRKEGAV